MQEYHPFPYNDQWSIIFLYFSIFLDKMPSNGPNNLLNVYLSIHTNLHGVVVLILAWRTVFFMRAISPKYYPALY